MNTIGPSFADARDGNMWSVSLARGDTIEIRTSSADATGLSFLPTAGAGVTIGNDIDVFLYRAGIPAFGVHTNEAFLGDSQVGPVNGTEVEDLTARAPADGTYVFCVEGYTTTGETYELHVDVNGVPRAATSIGDALLVHADSAGLLGGP
ncbi:MAG: hypothetical protein ACYDDF_05125 [Thermoplasmatota archaeon]